MKAHKYILAIGALALLPLHAATINFTGSGTVANASGLVEFSIHKNDGYREYSLFLDPLGTPGRYTDLVFFHEWYQDWLWVGFFMPELGLTDRTFSHFIGQDYTQTWTVNRTHAPSEGIRNANRSFSVAFTDGYVAGSRLHTYVMWEWDGSTVTGTMPWNITTFDPIANQRYVDSLPVTDSGSTALMLAFGLAGLLGHRLAKSQRSGMRRVHRSWDSD